jgi:hypothetical protein
MGFSATAGACTLSPEGDGRGLGCCMGAGSGGVGARVEIGAPPALPRPPLHTLWCKDEMNAGLVAPAWAPAVSPRPALRMLLPDNTYNGMNADADTASCGGSSPPLSRGSMLDSPTLLTPTTTLDLASPPIHTKPASDALGWAWPAPRSSPRRPPRELPADNNTNGQGNGNSNAVMALPPSPDRRAHVGLPALALAPFDDHADPNGNGDADAESNPDAAAGRALVWNTRPAYSVHFTAKPESLLALPLPSAQLRALPGATEDPAPLCAETDTPAQRACNAQRWALPVQVCGPQGPVPEQAQHQRGRRWQAWPTVLRPYYFLYSLRTLTRITMIT